MKQLANIEKYKRLVDQIELINRVLSIINYLKVYYSSLQGMKINLCFIPLSYYLLFQKHPF